MAIRAASSASTHSAVEVILKRCAADRKKGWKWLCGFEVKVISLNTPFRYAGINRKSCVNNIRIMSWWNFSCSSSCFKKYIIIYYCGVCVCPYQIYFSFFFFFLSGSPLSGSCISEHVVLPELLNNGRFCLDRISVVAHSQASPVQQAEQFSMRETE